MINGGSKFLMILGLVLFGLSTPILFFLGGYWMAPIYILGIGGIFDLLYGPFLLLAFVQAMVTYFLAKHISISASNIFVVVGKFFALLLVSIPLTVVFYVWTAITDPSPSSTEWVPRLLIVFLPLLFSAIAICVCWARKK
jgi:hypothetical protein